MIFILINYTKLPVLTYREDIQHINTIFKVHVQEQNIFPNLHPVYVDILQGCRGPAWVLLRVLDRLRTFWLDIECDISLINYFRKFELEQLYYFISHQTLISH